MKDNPADNGPLTPDDLAEEDERIEVLEENRYLVRPERPLRSDELEAVPDDLKAQLSGEVVEVEPELEDESEDLPALEDVPDPHGIDVTLKTDGEVTEYRQTSPDVREVFVEFLEWYAEQLDEDLSAEEVLQVMLATSDLDV